MAKKPAPPPPKGNRDHILQRNRSRRQEAHARRVKAALTKPMKVPRGTARADRRYDMDAFRNNKLKLPTGTVKVNGVMRG